MTPKEKKIVIIGDGEFAEIAYEYFTHDSEFEVVGFSVESDYLKKEKIYELPIIPFEKIENFFAPDDHHFFVAITFPKLNRVRTRLYLAAKEKGFKPASYISSRAFVWHDVKVGENCFIFENNVLQHYVEIGNNVILWSGNHIGHRSKIGNNCFISSHVVISGYCEIGENCFIGVNSTFADNIKMGADCFVGANCFINKNLENQLLLKAESTFEISKLNSLRYFKVES